MNEPRYLYKNCTPQGSDYQLHYPPCQLKMQGPGNAVLIMTNGEVVNIPLKDDKPVIIKNEPVKAIGAASVVKYIIASWEAPAVEAKRPRKLAEFRGKMMPDMVRSATVKPIKAKSTGPVCGVCQVEFDQHPGVQSLCQMVRDAQAERDALVAAILVDEGIPFPPTEREIRLRAAVPVYLLKDYNTMASVHASEP